MYKFNSDEFIREMESLEGVEETPLDYEEYEASLIWGESETERDLKGDM